MLDKKRILLPMNWEPEISLSEGIKTLLKT